MALVSRILLVSCARSLELVSQPRHLVLESSTWSRELWPRILRDQKHGHTVDMSLDRRQTLHTAAHWAALLAAPAVLVKVQLAPAASAEGVSIACDHWGWCCERGGSHVRPTPDKLGQQA